MKKKIFSVFFALVLVLTMSLVAAPVAADTINVSSGGDIQAAIDAATDGDIINVAAGTCTGNIDVNKRVILQASGTVTVNPLVSTDHIFHVTVNNVTIDGFTLVGDTLEPTSRGILLDGVTDCTISNNNWSASVERWAIELNNADGNIIQDNTLTSSSSPSGTGISLMQSDLNIVKGNTVTMDEGIGQAIWIETSSNNLIVGNTCTAGAEGGTGIKVVGNIGDGLYSGNTIKANTFTGEWTCGIWLHDGTNNIVEYNTSEATGGHNAFGIHTGYGKASSGNIIRYNTFSSETGLVMYAWNWQFPGEPFGTFTNIQFTNNTIIGQYGIRILADIDATAFTINNNSLLCTTYGVKNSGTGELNAQSNWWGTAVESEIQALIVEDPGTVDYSGWLATAPAAVGLTVVPDILPTVATTSPATNIGFFSATLSGGLTDMGTATQVDVWLEWGTTTSYGQTTPFEAKTGIGIFTAGLTGLTQGTVYHFRAVARSADGTTTGADVSFTTAIVPPAVTTNAATSVDLYSATLNGNLTILGGAWPVDLSFDWKIEGGTYAGVTATPSTASSVPTPFTADLINLTHNTTYYFRAKAVGDSTVYGDELSFTTVAERTGISVSPTSIDFGSILAGSSSGTKTVTVTNEGNVVSKFTTTLITEVPEGFYTANLAIDDVAVGVWLEENVAVEDTATPGLVLTIPGGVAAGPKTATIIFWVTKQ